jgi:hypothetical protein
MGPIYRSPCDTGETIKVNIAVGAGFVLETCRMSDFDI